MSDGWDTGRCLICNNENKILWILMGGWVGLWAGEFKVQLLHFNVPCSLGSRVCTMIYDPGVSYIAMGI